MKKTTLLLLALICLTVTAFAQDDCITVHMIGDSTMANKPVIPANPERGWGQMLHMYFKESVRVANHARNGRSTKSFIAGGGWDKVVAALKPGDYILIQFGHNDEKVDNARVAAAPFGDHTTNLLHFVRDAREHQAIPILATPVSRGNFDESGTLKNSRRAYADAARKFVETEKVPLLDLFVATGKLLQQLGPESDKRLFVWMPAGEFSPNSKKIEDNTHFNTYGATRVCDLAAVELEDKVPALAAHLIGNSKRAGPVTPALDQ